MMLGPKGQALSYHVPTKYLFLPNSQAQSLKIPSFVNKIKAEDNGKMKEKEKGGNMDETVHLPSRNLSITI